MFSWEFWKQSLERAVKSAAQAVVLGLGLAEGLDLFTLDWALVGGLALGGAFLSVLTSIISAPFGENGSPSAVPMETTPVDPED